MLWSRKRLNKRAIRITTPTTQTGVICARTARQPQQQKDHRSTSAHWSATCWPWRPRSAETSGSMKQRKIRSLQKVRNNIILSVYLAHISNCNSSLLVYRQTAKLSNDDHLMLHNYRSKHQKYFSKTQIPNLPGTSTTPTARLDTMHSQRSR